MNENSDRYLENTLKQFPKHRLHELKEKEIYNQLMQTAEEREHKENNKNITNPITIGIATLAAVLMLSLISITFINDKAKNNKSEIEVFIVNQAETIVELIKNKNFEELANYVHDEKGLLFSPYIYIEEDSLVFSAEDVSSFLENKELYLWGIYDGKGNPIELTTEGYYEEFIYSRDFVNPDEVIYYTDFNDVEYVGNQRSSMINNINEVFPDAHVVEFFLDEVYDDELIFAWRSINLVFEKNNEGIWKLIAIVSDQWTT